MIFATDFIPVTFRYIGFMTMYMIIGKLDYQVQINRNSLNDVSYNANAMAAADLAVTELT